jgi:hypothetical protein
LVAKQKREGATGTDDLCFRAATARVAAQIHMDVAAAVAAGSAEKNGGGGLFYPENLMQAGVIAEFVPKRISP